MRRLRILAAIAAMAAGTALAGSAGANARPGPYPHTALSRNGALIWYTGRIDVAGHTFREMDDLCRTVPITQVTGWRAPTEAEVRSLFVALTQSNGIARWTDLYPDGQTLEPAVPPFNPSNRNPAQINIMVRDVFTYEGQPTTLAQVQRGRMYIIHWFNRWTLPTISVRQSIRYAPGDFPLGPNERLLCVADHAPGRANRQELAVDTRYLHRRPALAIALAAVAGCSSQPSGLKQWNDAAAASEIADQLASKGFTLGDSHSCGEWFGLEPTHILDVSFPGGSGMSPGVLVQVKASTPVQAKQPVVAGSPIANLCYGWPTGGWSVGQVSNYVHTFTFKRWRSGWHIVENSGS